MTDADKKGARRSGRPISPAAPRRWVRLGRESRRKQLLHVANSILLTEGPRALTMERLSAAAAISKPVVYSHFANRGALLVTLLENHWKLIDDAQMRAVRGERSAQARLDAGLAAFFDVVERDGVGVRRLIRAAVDEPALAAILARRERVINERLGSDIARETGMSWTEATTLASILRAAIHEAANRVADAPEARPTVQRIMTAFSRAVLASAVAGAKRSSSGR